jgi:cytochrome c-type biogenesis protein
MGEWMLVGGSALWLGILTSMSPCPMATNVAAISFVGRRVGNPRRVFLAGLFYTLGRSLAYLALGIVLVGGLTSVPHVSYVLQKHMNRFLGPILILVGMLLLELLQLNLPGFSVGEGVQRRVEAWGVWGAGALGFVFALSFCPISAALFFGSLLPLAVKAGSSVWLPSLYGVGTALPVFIFSVLIGLGTRAISEALDRLALIERWARRATGVVFIGVGIYYTLTYVFGVLHL